MCGIAGFFNSGANYLSNKEKYESILRDMIHVLYHRGPDENGSFLGNHVGLAHTRLSIIDLSTGSQPMFRKIGEQLYGIIYNGEIYNMKELKQDLENKGWQFTTTSDTEVILLGYLEYGVDYVKQLNGIFAYSIWDSRKDLLLLFRDRSGIKPLFYTLTNDTLVFASEIKGIFSYPDITPQLDMEGLNEIFSIGPAKTYGCGVFKGVDELLPGHYLTAHDKEISVRPYWKLESRPHEDSDKETIEKTRYLVTDSIKRQLLSDVPVCTFLSGGVDSSLVSAVCAGELKKKGEQLTTFSFDFKHNDKYFQSNSFQPTRDRPYVEKMVSFINSRHYFLECDNLHQADLLYESVNARDLPAMADVDSSLLYFCSLVKNYNKVVLTGECADEIFGGYPWFHREEFFRSDTFPWTPDLAPRKALLSEDFLNSLAMDTYVKNAYEKSVKETPKLKEDNKTEEKRREISYLNLKWFMQTLLDRMDRTSMYSGLEARVPFADHRIIEYVFNVPWKMKTKDGVVKGLLRESARGLLPDEILFRKKSPYPKTYDPHYEKLLKDRFLTIIEDSSSPILSFIDKKKAMVFLSSPSDYGRPWYGQLMAGPQMLAYLIQVNYWLQKFKIRILW